MNTRTYIHSLCVALAALILVLPVSASFAAPPVIPQIIAAMGRQLDRQVVEKLHQQESPAKGVSLFMTTPVDLSDLETSNPLARQVQEELAAWFVQNGYSVQEIRKGTDLLFEPLTGELLLTRRSNLISQEVVGSSAVVVGTYTATPQHVRFNMRLMLTGSQEVIAMTSITIPVNHEVAGLLNSSGAGGMGMPIAPSMVTQLP